MAIGRSLARGQRVVLVVGAGIGLLLLGGYVTSRGAIGPTGWVAYAPLTNSSLSPLGGMHAWLRLLVWLALLAIWVALSLWILRPTSDRASE